jgi:carbonic anhydrase/acetyltransferase-like protein (isoleucine patch superfamily)
VQDGSVIHLSDDYGVSLGAHVSVGHRAIIHACTIDDEVLVGMGAIVMDGTEIGARSIIGAGAVVTQHQKIPPGSLVLGSPAKVVRSLTEEEQRKNRKLADKYVNIARFHREHLAKSLD